MLRGGDVQGHIIFRTDLEGSPLWGSIGNLEAGQTQQVLWFTGWLRQRPAHLEHDFLERAPQPYLDVWAVARPASYLGAAHRCYGDIGRHCPINKGKWLLRSAQMRGRLHKRGPHADLPGQVLQTHDLHPGRV